MEYLSIAIMTRDAMYFPCAHQSVIHQKSVPRLVPSRTDAPRQPNNSPAPPQKTPKYPTPGRCPLVPSACQAMETPGLPRTLLKSRGLCPDDSASGDATDADDDDDDNTASTVTLAKSATVARSSTARPQHMRPVSYWVHRARPSPIEASRKSRYLSQTARRSSTLLAVWLEKATEGCRDKMQKG